MITTKFNKDHKQVYLELDDAKGKQITVCTKRNGDNLRLRFGEYFLDRADVERLIPAFESFAEEGRLI